MPFDTHTPPSPATSPQAPRRTAEKWNRTSLTPADRRTPKVGHFRSALLRNFHSAFTSETTARQLQNGGLLDAIDNVVLIGGRGTGKRHVATAIGVQLGERRRSHADKEGRRRLDPPREPPRPITSLFISQWKSRLNAAWKSTPGRSFPEQFNFFVITAKNSFDSCDARLKFALTVAGK
jgi:DNA replication protein DnaC